jgi:ferredoxin
MVTKTIRKIVKINEEKCDGCGACVIACAEGALKIVNGKAKLVSEKYCDGLGACLDCPQGAITIEEREAQEYDEMAAAENLTYKKPDYEHVQSCSSTNVTQFEGPAKTETAPVSHPITPSRLRHWPVQLTLVPPAAPFLKNADVVLAADCVAFTCPDFQRDFLGENTALLVACPKLDNFQAHQSKLNEILKKAGIKSLTVLHMEVPCCSGLVHMAKQAILASGNVVPFRDITISIWGEQKTG